MTSLCGMDLVAWKIYGEYFGSFGYQKEPFDWGDRLLLLTRIFQLMESWSPIVLPCFHLVIHHGAQLRGGHRPVNGRLLTCGHGALNPSQIRIIWKLGLGGNGRQLFWLPLYLCNSVALALGWERTWGHDDGIHPGTVTLCILGRSTPWLKKKKLKQGRRILFLFFRIEN